MTELTAPADTSADDNWRYACDQCGQPSDDVAPPHGDPAVCWCKDCLRRYVVCPSCHTEAILRGFDLCEICARQADYEDSFQDHYGSDR